MTNYQKKPNKALRYLGYVLAYAPPTITFLLMVTAFIMQDPITNSIIIVVGIALVMSMIYGTKLITDNT